MTTGLRDQLKLTEQIISCCFEVHNVLGPGLAERFYRDALMQELASRGLKAEKEREYSVEYKGALLGTHRVDIIVEDVVLVELKAVEGQLKNIHVAQAISERNVSGLPVALLINFGDTSVQIRRLERRSEQREGHSSTSFVRKQM
jgi:GxxExxY protein